MSSKGAIEEIYEYLNKIITPLIKSGKKIPLITFSIEERELSISSMSLESVAVRELEGELFLTYFSIGLKQPHKLINQYAEELPAKILKCISAELTRIIQHNKKKGYVPVLRIETAVTKDEAKQVLKSFFHIFFEERYKEL